MQGGRKGASHEKVRPRGGGGLRARNMNVR